MSPRARAAPTERTRAEWTRRVEAEYASAAITQHLTLWLIQIGCSPDLIRDGLAIVGDELAHAELAHAVVAACPSPPGRPLTLARAGLGLARTGDDALEDDVVRACVRVFCLGETVAVRLFRALRAGCTVPVARRALDRVLRDEVRHRDFGWALLGWLLDGDAADARRALVERELPELFAGLRENYGASDARACSPSERAWGLMPAIEYRDVLVATVERDFVPRFSRLGLDARRAWQSRA
ncbi:MAG TPA: ferritin-like domain-containing protein [Polyangia bacterium]|nr:ferritin-like domain-containing protein [Polyangia bacterium]